MGQKVLEEEGSRTGNLEWEKNTGEKSLFDIHHVEINSHKMSGCSEKMIQGMDIFSLKQLHRITLSKDLR